MVNRHPVIRVLRNIAGFALILLGIVGLVLPILQGILFIVMGLALIDLPIKHRMHVWLGNRFASYRWIALQHHRAKRRVLRRHRARRARKADLARHPEPNSPPIAKGVSNLDGSGEEV